MRIGKKDCFKYNVLTEMGLQSRGFFQTAGAIEAGEFRWCNAVGRRMTICKTVLVAMFSMVDPREAV